MKHREVAQSRVACCRGQLLTRTSMANGNGGSMPQDLGVPPLCTFVWKGRRGERDPSSRRSTATRQESAARCKAREPPPGDVPTRWACH
eukprot:scaffold212718_cov31-Tisochrysis_lutea.AAC.2